MTFLFRWSAAFLLVSLLVGFTHLTANCLKVDTPASDQFPLSVNHSDVVFIGTSLFAYGIPIHGQGLLDERSTHTRLAWPLMTESETLDLLEKTLQIAGVRTVVIELSPFVRDFRDEVEIEPLSFLEPVRDQSVQFKINLNVIRYHLFSSGVQQKSKFYDEPPIDKNLTFDSAVFLQHYPFYIRSPKHPLRLAQLLEVAKARSIEVHFVLPPRARFAANYLGKDLLAKLTQQSVLFANNFGVQVWIAGEAWENHLFVDHAHLNRSGREQFIAFLKAHAEQPNVQ